MVVAALANATVAIPAALFGGIAGVFLVQVVAALVAVYALATTARAYDQLIHMREIPESEPRPGPTGTPA